MNTDETSDTAQPFKALIAASSLIAAVLYLAGFAFRWSYYYNFGVQHLVFNLSLQAILTASMEMIKQPRNMVATVLLLPLSLVCVNLLLSTAKRVSKWQQPGKLMKPIAESAKLLKLENPLVTDCARALVVLYVVYMLSSQMGYIRFRKDIVNSRENSLPAVTAIVQGDEYLAVACGKEWEAGTNFIGNGRLAREIEEYHRTCTSESSVWRLLYRDEKSIYLFATEPKATGRPLTIVLPNTEKTVLVME
jgi:hypothetical protein